LKKDDLLLLPIEGRVFNRSLAFDRFACVDAHLCKIAALSLSLRPTLPHFMYCIHPSSFSLILSPSLKRSQDRESEHSTNKREHSSEEREHFIIPDKQYIVEKQMSTIVIYLACKIL
jgi:hypothetical protein